MFGDNGQPDMETIAMKNELQDLIEKMDSMNKVSICLWQPLIQIAI